MFLTPFIAFFLCAAALALLILASISTPVVRTFFFLSVSQANGIRFGLWGWCSIDTSVSRCSTKALGIDWDPELTPFWLTKALIAFPIAAGLTFLALLSLLPQLFTLCRHRHAHRRIHHANRHSYTYAPYPPTMYSPYPQQQQNYIYTPQGELLPPPPNQNPNWGAYGEPGPYEYSYGYPSPAYAVLVSLASLASLLALAFALALFVPARNRWRKEGYEASLGNCIWFAVGATGALFLSLLGVGCGCCGGVVHGRFTRASPYLAYNV